MHGVAVIGYQHVYDEDTPILPISTENTILCELTDVRSNNYFSAYVPKTNPIRIWLYSVFLFVFWVWFKKSKKLF